MSSLLVQTYLNDLADLRRASGSERESVVREAFKSLLKSWGRSKGLIFIPEYEHVTAMSERRYVDGALVEAQMRLPLGYWEAKDTNDDLDAEIAKKFRRGYPQDNIIFEDTRIAVLYQDKKEITRALLTDPVEIERLVTKFFAYEPEVIQEFRKAVAQFKDDIPAVLETLRKAIAEAEAANDKFKKAEIKFLKHAQETINPSVTPDDVREMLIQHILTEEIFSQVFDTSDFHHNNNVAKELYALEGTFFTGGVKHATLGKLRPYYAAIRSAAAKVSSHQEKQKFLKVIYENFYKVYNRKAADRLGVAYTPNEIVRFMIESADWLCQKHFGKKLIDKNVEILDPATGTGTFIVDLLEHFRGQPEKLKYKYLHELHANEVAILPYYVANLNIEATYAAIMGEYEEFPSLCFVDTLDNVAGLRSHGVGKDQHYGDLLGGVSAENVARIKRQNARKISVVIGNPPYNANQLNENENNKNREYPEIDRRIKETYIEESTAQKTKAYDMYARFFRWASDRIESDGIIAFITNRSFVESRTFDGFRKVVGDEFNEIYVIDLGGDVRDDPRLSGTKHNVFGIQTGVAISLMVRRRAGKGCRIFYCRRPQLEVADDKLDALAGINLENARFEELRPNERHDWIVLKDSDFVDFIPIAAKETKLVKVAAHERAIFKLMSFGVATNRDEWLVGQSANEVVDRAKYFIERYEKVRQLHPSEKTIDGLITKFASDIKWTTELRAYAVRNVALKFDRDCVRPVQYRPYVNLNLYYDRVIVHRVYQQDAIFPVRHKPKPVQYIAFTDPTAQKPWLVVASDRIADLHLVGAAAGAVCLPLVRVTENGEESNITDWALDQFSRQYQTGPRPKRLIDKDAIFHYVYGVLHDPVYREKYALNLKREFPRIPFYADFWKWAEWGEKLMALHIGYEKVEPWPLARIDTVDATAKKSGVAPKAILKALKETGAIVLDSDTQLTGVPPAVWDYRLGNRSALEWILDQYKEKTPKDPTIREKFNTYKFADYKDHVIDLLMRVTRVSVETQAIVEAMRAGKAAR